jgi:hypothetical protein
MSKTIEKKVLAEYFEQILAGEETYELRLADWDCKSGDLLVLTEIDANSKKPTGRKMHRKVGYVGKTKGLDFWTDNEISKNGYQIISLLESDELPEIRIKDAWLLRQNASKHLHELLGKDMVLADDEWMEKRVKEYQDAWEPYEKKTLTAMTEILGLSFRQNVIDVYIAPWFGAFSDPMVIGVMREPGVFVDTLTHELLHRLLTDNTSVPHDTPLLAEWQELFGNNHTFGTIVHIPVHAVHKAIYLDVLKEPKRLKRDIAENSKNNASDYVSAWNYVDNHDYKKIISQLKKSYLELSKGQK